MNHCCETKPIMECPIEKVCDKYIVHEVPHYIPINIKHINHHIYKHTYIPVYKEVECDMCENVYERCNNQEIIK